MTRRFILAHQMARAGAKREIDQAPDGYEVVIKEPTRNADQSAKFHAICGDLAKSGLEWGGSRRSLDAWKVLLVSAHAAATKQAEVEIVVGLEGELVNIRESTAAMSRARSSSLIEYALHFCVVHEIPLSNQSQREAAALSAAHH